MVALRRWKHGNFPLKTNQQEPINPQSFSDLRSAVGGGALTPVPVSRTKKVIDPRLHSSEGDIQEESSMALSMTTSESNRSDELSACDESLCDELPSANGSVMQLQSPDAPPIAADSCATPPKPSKSSKMLEAEMNNPKQQKRKLRAAAVYCDAVAIFEQIFH